MRTIAVIPTLADNYTYVLECEGEAVAIDPGEASPVLRWLRESGCSLRAVLCTHGHFDHTTGSEQLARVTGCELHVPASSSESSFPGMAGQAGSLQAGPFQFSVIPTPGHSEDSVCYYLPPSDGSPGAVFTGDTLFVGGCGRLFTHSPETMWASFRRLASLPPDTRVYCGHDYALEDYEFAVTLEPGNARVKERLDEIRALVESGQLTVPSTVALELATNPFMRASDTMLKRALAMPDARDVDVFAELRRRKDRF
ncbi:MAG: hydroxyacylglutathione hydrolase [Chloroflexi bacterium]|nr:hydroxyacylglutathione hydrolase [Chloroflexota bacterium]